MGKVYEITRKRETIKVRVVDRLQVIDDKVAVPGDLDVVEGLEGERYRIQYNAALAGYEIHGDLLEEMNRAKDGR